MTPFVSRAQIKLLLERNQGHSDEITACNYAALGELAIKPGLRREPILTFDAPARCVPIKPKEKILLRVGDCGDDYLSAYTQRCVVLYYDECIIQQQPVFYFNVVLTLAVLGKVFYISLRTV